MKEPKFRLGEVVLHNLKNIEVKVVAYTDPEGENRMYKVEQQEVNHSFWVYESWLSRIVTN